MHRKTHVPDDVQFLTQPLIAVVLVDQVTDGIAMQAWTLNAFKRCKMTNFSMAWTSGSRPSSAKSRRTSRGGRGN